MSHSVLAPSKSPIWGPDGCAGALAAIAEANIPQTSSVYADEGSAAHAVASARLLGESEVAALAHLRTFYTNDADYYVAMNFVDVYVQQVRNAAEGKILMVEQSLSIETWTGEKGGKGTADAVIIDLKAEELEVWDLKFGQGHIVDAERNPQTRLYGLGALSVVEAFYGPMKRIKQVISQPRRDHLSEWTDTREELLAFGAKTQEAGFLALSLIGKPKAEWEKHLHPSEESCLWCPVKATCPALAKLVQDTVFEEFAIVENGEVKAVAKSIDGQDIPTEGMLNMIADWISAKRDWIDAKLRAGIDMPGWKLVLGKKGNRKWTDEAKIEELLKSLKFKKAQMYEEKLIPLGKIEKLVPKPKWPVFEAYITQAPAQPVAVSASDKRAEWKPTQVSEFENVEEDAYAAFR